MDDLPNSMTKTSVIPVSDDRMKDWLRVYNNGKENMPNFMPEYSVW